jgi:DNA-binding transcriptional ArsR family regulator
VEYRLSAATSENAAGEILTALRLVFRRRGQPIATLFKLATAFTHPRRIEVFRAVKGGTLSLGKLQTATNISARALSRHLAKLEARGFVKSELAVCAVINQTNPFGRVLARLAGQ